MTEKRRGVYARRNIKYVLDYGMKKEYIENIIESFGSEGRIFENEAQFKFDLAWRIKESLCSEFSVLLEYRLSEKKEYTDIVIANGEYRVAIELKYRLADNPIKYVILNDKEIETSAQGAADIGCYGFLKDIERLENNKELGIITQGFAIIISNYPLMWGENARIDTNWAPMCLDKEFQAGKINWKNGAPRDEYKEEIVLKSSYKMVWKEYKLCDYKEIKGRRCKDHPFKYLIVEV